MVWSAASALNSMTGHEFEELVAEIFRRKGYEVRTTPVSGDYGVDIVASRGEDRVAVQCKRQVKPVSGGAIQEVVAGKAVYNCTSTMVVTNQVFTQAAIELARRNGCQLIDGSALAEFAFEALIRTVTPHLAADSAHEAKMAAAEQAAARAAAERTARAAAEDAEWRQVREKRAVEAGDMASMEELLAESIGERNWTEAARLADKIVKLGRRYDLVLKLADALREAGHLDAAERTIAKVAGHLPAEKSAASLARLLVHQERWAEAEESATLVPDGPPYLRFPTEKYKLEIFDLLCRARADRGDWEEAEALAIRSPFPESLLSALCSQRIAIGDWEEAEALAIRSPFPQSLLSVLAEARSSRREWLEAERLHDKAAECASHPTTQQNSPKAPAKRHVMYEFRSEISQPDTSSD